MGASQVVESGPPETRIPSRPRAVTSIPWWFTSPIAILLSAALSETLLAATGSLGVPIAAGALYPTFRLLLSQMIAAAAMSLSFVSLIGNALRLRRVEL